jgi:hypothetical protein
MTELAGTGDPRTISLGSGERRATDQHTAGRRSSQVVRECLLGTGCYPSIGHATDTLPGPITSAKVLLTRGLLACVIYSVDQETQHMLASLGIPEPPTTDQT